MANEIQLSSKEKLEAAIDALDLILDSHVLGIEKLPWEKRRRLQAKRNGLAVELNEAFPVTPNPTFDRTDGKL